MKRTHKFRALGDVGKILQDAPSITEAARRLGVDRSTLKRWVQRGKVVRPATAPPVPLPGAPDMPAAPPVAADWQARVTAEYALGATDLELVDLAAAALVLSRDGTTRPAERLAAMGRFALLVRQLNLHDEKRRQPAGGLALASGTLGRVLPMAARKADPRAGLMAVK